MTDPVTSSIRVPGGVIGTTSWRGEDGAVLGLHGFTLCGAMFRELAGGRTLLAADLPGHGASRLEPLTMAATVTALSRVIEAAGPFGLVLGYSMGGRVALHLALEHPHLVSGLLLVSTGLGIEDATARRDRRTADEGLAAAAVELGIERFIAAWIDHPIAGTSRVPDPIRTADRAIRLTNDVSGLAAALAGLGPAAHEPLHERLSGIAVPTTWMAGAADTAYTSIAAEAARRSGGELIVVPAAGHNLVLERPQAVQEVMERLAS